EQDAQRRIQHAGRKRDCVQVVDRSPEEILLDLAVHTAGKHERRCAGAFEDCASRTMATMRARAVSAPTLVARKRNAPCWLRVPPTTSSPGPFATGTSSPVSIDSST